MCVKLRRDRINAFPLQNDSNKQNLKHKLRFFKQQLIQRGVNRNIGAIFRLAKLAFFGYIERKAWFQPSRNVVLKFTMDKMMYNMY